MTTGNCQRSYSSLSWQLSQDAQASLPSISASVSRLAENLRILPLTRSVASYKLSLLASGCVTGRLCLSGDTPPGPGPEG